MNGYDYGLAESVQAHWLGLVEHDWLCPLLKSRDVLEAFLRKNGYGSGDAILPCPECGGHHTYMFLRTVLEAIPEWKIEHLRKSLESPNGFVIQPYRKEEKWLFTDGRLGFSDEQLGGGNETILDAILAQLDPPFDFGFYLRFADRKIEDWCYSLEWRRPEPRGGDWYYCPQLDRDEWLCQAFHRYFKAIPPLLYIAWERIPRKFPDDMPAIPYELADGAIFKIEKLDTGEYRVKVAFDDGRVLALKLGNEIPDFNTWRGSPNERKAMVAKWYFEAQERKHPDALEFERYRSRIRHSGSHPEGQ